MFWRVRIHGLHISIQGGRFAPLEELDSSIVAPSFLGKLKLHAPSLFYSHNNLEIELLKDWELKNLRVSLDCSLDSRNFHVSFEGSEEVTRGVLNSPSQDPSTIDSHIEDVLKENLSSLGLEQNEGSSKVFMNSFGVPDIEGVVWPINCLGRSVDGIMEEPIKEFCGLTGYGSRSVEDTIILYTLLPSYKDVL